MNQKTSYLILIGFLLLGVVIGRYIFPAKSDPGFSVPRSTPGTKLAKNLTEPQPTVPFRITPLPAPTAVPSRPPTYFANRSDHRLSDPKFAGILHQINLRTAKSLYGAVVREMHLQPDQEAKLFEVLAQRATAVMDVNDVMKSTDASDQERLKARDAATAEFLPQLTVLVGPDGVDALNKAGADQSATVMVEGGIGRDLRAAGIPLSAEQTGLLSKLYKESISVEATKVVRSNGIDSDPSLSPRFQVLYNQAASFLSPQQLEILHESLATRTAYGNYLTQNSSSR